ncbi:MAG: hypothetical protein K9H25_10505 [Rhodospirillum sp.]|nr:hypothetical protein [Rhodospirillum sp.]MCF8488478.1 hypothetical protein [Rhodospirillum sp.]MCF8502382.1 hypothetical protein [Rhodospirillum sp.]
MDQQDFVRGDAPNVTLPKGHNMKKADGSRIDFQYPAFDGQDLAYPHLRVTGGMEFRGRMRIPP